MGVLVNPYCPFNSLLIPSYSRNYMRNYWGSRDSGSKAATEPIGTS